MALLIPRFWELTLAQPESELVLLQLANPHVVMAGTSLLMCCHAHDKKCIVELFLIWMNQPALEPMRWRGRREGMDLL